MVVPLPRLAPVTDLPLRVPPALAERLDLLRIFGQALANGFLSFRHEVGERFWREDFLLNLVEQGRVEVVHGDAEPFGQTVGPLFK